LILLTKCLPRSGIRTTPAHPASCRRIWDAGRPIAERLERCTGPVPNGSIRSAPNGNLHRSRRRKSPNRCREGQARQRHRSAAQSTGTGQLQVWPADLQCASDTPHSRPRPEPQVLRSGLGTIALAQLVSHSRRPLGQSLIDVPVRPFHDLDQRSIQASRMLRADVANRRNSDCGSARARANTPRSSTCPP